MSEQHTGSPGQDDGEGQGKQSLIIRTMEFYGDELVAVMTPDKQIWVHLARLIESLGLSLSDQLEHIRGNKTLNAGLRTFVVPTRRGALPAQFLRLGLVAFYLARIQPQRAKPELRDKIERYQEQAADVLYAAFLGEFGIIEPGRSQSEQGLTAAEQNYQQAQILANVARQQLAIEREVGDLGERVTGQQQILDLYDERIALLELRLGTDDRITEEQATEIKEAVKGIGVLKAETSHNSRLAGPTIQAVWGMLYREFGVTVYRNLPRNRFDEVMRFLAETKRSMLGGK
jgi:hypothetical protein